LELNSTPSQDQSSSPNDARQSIEIIGIALAGVVTVVMAERSFTLLSALVGLIILVVLRHEDFGQVETRIYSALCALGILIIFGYWVDMLLLFAMQKMDALSRVVGSTGSFLRDIGFLPNVRFDLGDPTSGIGDPGNFRPGPVWMAGYVNLFQFLMVVSWYMLAGLIWRRRTRKNGWRYIINWWNVPSRHGAVDD
jgi:hypothetical protein